MRPIAVILLAVLPWGGRLGAALVSHHRFDEPAAAATAVNEVAGASPGTVGAAVTTGLAGIAANAYRFDSNATQAGIVDMGNASFFPAIHASGALTFSAWVKTSDTTGGRNAAIFAGNDTVASSYVDMGLAATQAGEEGSASGRLRPNGNNNITEIFSTPKVINDNAWHHVALTIRLGAGPGNIVLYVDGVARETGTTAAAPFPLFNNLEIGRLGRNAPADPFDGLIDDVQVYDHALSAGDVAFLHANPGVAIGGAPSVAADAITMHHHGSASIDVLANDAANVQPGTLEVLTSPQFGTAAVDSMGHVLYKHLTGFPKTDTFTYRVQGASGVFSGPVAVTISFSGALRIGNTTVNMPDAPPAVDYTTVNAFPGVGFTNPSTMESPPGDTKRIFVAERGGKIYVIPDVTATNPVKLLYLDLSAITLDDGNEQGLKGFAFHPDFASNGYVFVSYNHLQAGSEYVRVSRFKSENPAANTPIGIASERILINQHYFPESGNQPRIHNIDECNFGPDGYLYVGFGDEDGHPDPSNNSQRIDKDFWSGLLRLDVDLEPAESDDTSLPPNAHPAVVLHDGFPLYEIPADNPWVGAVSFNGLPVVPANVRSEFFAVGLRNPWQFTFDPFDGRLWLADVGLNKKEEVNVITKGGNYGWAFLEGDLPTKGIPPAGAVLTGPVWAYDHGDGPFQGKAIIGGLVYRGDRYASLYGKYIFGDYLSGNIWAMSTDGGPPAVERIAGESGIAMFAVDPSDSSLLMLDHGDGIVRRLVGTTAGGGFPATLGETGVFADLADLAPNPGVVAYQPNLSFWSDHAVKKRWLVIKNTTDQFGYSAEGPWQSPPGAVFVKHFGLEMERGNPATEKRIETRLLVRTEGGSYGVSYRWNEQGTEAHLVPDEGTSIDMEIMEQGSPVAQTWQIPSRSQCSTCHTPQAGHFLSLNTRQLNRPGTLAGSHGNFLGLLEFAAYLDDLPESPNTLPRHVAPDETNYGIETRARAYLAVNCAYCHQSDGIGGGDFDLRAHFPLESTGIVDGASSTAGSPFKLIVPGDHGKSVIWNRAAAANGFTRMPPLASSEIDQVGIDLLREWIDGTLPENQTYNQWRLERFGSLVSAEGEPGEDPDGDGRDNRHEFLTRTDPESGASLWNPGLVVNDTWLSFQNLENRSIRVESSTNLLDWKLWDQPGNDGLPVSGPTRNYPRDPADPGRFFKFRIEKP